MSGTENTPKSQRLAITTPIEYGQNGNFDLKIKNEGVKANESQTGIREQNGVKLTSTLGTGIDSSPTLVSRDVQEKPEMSRAWKYLLLSVFCLGVFIDVMGICAFYVLTGPVARDLGIDFYSQTWVITSFGVTFSAFLLFWGRVSDLYSPKPVFSYGFLSLGIFNLIISFSQDQYTFLVLRALSGICGACLIPSSYRLITFVFSAQELPFAFTVYSLCGALGASLGVPVGGLVELIEQGGQMSGWRWFFRILTAMIVPLALWSIRAFPKPPGQAAGTKDKWKRLDLTGTLIMLFAILLLIMGLTFGASIGFKSAAFLAPFLISLVLFPLFFWYESRLPSESALIPSETWKTPNLALWVGLFTFTNAWWACFQLPLIETWTELRDERSIISAVRILPSGISSLIGSIILIAFPIICATPRFSYTVGQLGGMAGFILAMQSRGLLGDYYWKFVFTGLTIGSFANNISCTTAVVGAMTSTKADQAGVIGAILQTSCQAGNVIAIAIQAGFYTIYPGGIQDFRNVEASYWFNFALGGAYLVIFWIFWRPTKIVHQV